MRNRLLADELYNYLVALSSILAAVGEARAAERVLRVSKFASGSTSELYGEARLLLPEILQKAGGSMPEAERVRLREVIAGIESEFERIGGG